MRRFSLVICAAATAVLATPALAGIIEYGDFAANTVDFLDVTETSDNDPVPLYGAPFTTGDSLFFNNMTFSALAKGAGGVDNTTGILRTTISAHDGEVISGLSFHESGSYTLSGLMNDAFAAVAAAYIINVLEIDGVPVDPINHDALMSFDPSDGDYSIGEDGAGTGLWSGMLDVDIDALIAASGRSGSATAVSVTITNTLSALSQDGTSATISKKDLAISVVPAPSAAFLFLLGAASGGRRRRV